MPLTIVATPIGNQDDLTDRAKQVLAAAEVIICEEAKEGRRFLKQAGIPFPRMESLNEHSTKEDVEALTALCAEKSVALISDCGTPGFCDPGADLVANCRKLGIEVTAAPGASSLMTFLSLAGRRLDQFVFAGFLPVQPEARMASIRELKGETRAVILMDTPYRLERLMDELARHMPERNCVLGIDLTTADERIFEGKVSSVASLVKGKKAEFILLLESSRAKRPDKNTARNARSTSSTYRRR